MALKLSIFVATYNAEARQEPYKEALACYHDLADEVIEVKDPWPQEFDWPFIGQIFQKGYERATGDWVLRMDLDYIISPQDFNTLKQSLDRYKDEPAISLFKYQFILVDRYNLKSRIVVALNKGKYGDRIKLNSGGDLCAPALDGLEIKPDNVPEARVPIWNYDFSFKDRQTVKQDFGRFARAWQKHFGEYKLGGPDDQSAFDYFMYMQSGKFKRPSKIIRFEEHPEYIKDKLRTLTADQFGYSLWGNVDPAGYYA